LHCFQKQSTRGIATSQRDLDLIDARLRRTRELHELHPRAREVRIIVERDKIDDIPVTPSSGNVFADLGLPNPDEELFKADLVLQFIRAMRKRGLTQARAAKLLGVSQSNVSHLIHGHYEG